MTHPAPEEVTAEHSYREERARETFAAGKKDARRTSITVRCGSCHEWVRAEGVDDGSLAEIMVDSDCPICGGEMSLERRSVR